MRAYCSYFNFKGASQQTKVGDLSGGERNRCVPLLRLQGREMCDDLTLRWLSSMMNILLSLDLSDRCAHVLACHGEVYQMRSLTH